MRLNLFVKGTEGAVSTTEVDDDEVPSDGSVFFHEGRPLLCVGRAPDEDGVPGVLVDAPPASVAAMVEVPEVEQMARTSYQVAIHARPGKEPKTWEQTDELTRHMFRASAEVMLGRKGPKGRQ